MSLEAINKIKAARIRQALLHNRKSASTEELIGCTIPELRAHLEKQFLPGMSWDNHAITGWHIDHRIPCDSFDLTNENIFFVLQDYSNMQPLWYDDNIRKGTLVLG